MNDTNLNDRQKKILSVLKEKSGISRATLASIVSSGVDISRITFIRDLNFLIGMNLVKTSGKGKNTVYGLVETNPLLTYLDLENYFKSQKSF